MLNRGGNLRILGFDDYGNTGCGVFIREIQN
jgi:hypothetical protein